jgi:ABC-type nickel/cobalt efflux system permease component RcnA
MIRRTLLAITISFAMLALGAVSSASAEEQPPSAESADATAAHGVESSGPHDPAHDEHAAAGHGGGHHEDPSKTFNFTTLN